MGYKIVITLEAKEDLERFIRYLAVEKENIQAAKSLLDDFELTKDKLTYVAKSLKKCDNSKLKELGYRRINFSRHRYFILYRIDGDVAFIDNIFHELQDYENKMH